MSEMSTKERLLSLQNFVNSQIGEELDLTEGIKKLAEQGGGKDTFDIFWHGETHGWAEGFDTGYYQNQQGSGAAISINHYEIQRSNSSNANIFLKGRPITRGKYTKMKFIVGSGGNAGKWNHLEIGFRKASNPDYTYYSGGLDYQYNVMHYDGHNIAGSSPWYNLPAGEYEVDITDIPEDEEVILGFDCCDNWFRFMSVWLE